MEICENCGFEDDCMGGLCQECEDDLTEEARLMTEAKKEQ